MDVSQVDRSKYYRGLLVLTGRDLDIDPRERELMLRFGKVLDFDKRFCEAAINDVLHNKYLPSEPVVFDNRETAECFLHDAIRLALIDDAMHPEELAWLQDVAGANGLPVTWLDAEISRFLDLKGVPEGSLEIERLLAG